MYSTTASATNQQVASKTSKIYCLRIGAIVALCFSFPFLLLGVSFSFSIGLGLGLILLSAGLLLLALFTCLCCMSCRITRSINENLQHQTQVLVTGAPPPGAYQHYDNRPRQHMPQTHNVSGPGITRYSGYRPPQDEPQSNLSTDWYGESSDYNVPLEQSRFEDFSRSGEATGSRESDAPPAYWKVAMQ